MAFFILKCYNLAIQHVENDLSGGFMFYKILSDYYQYIFPEEKKVEFLSKFFQNTKNLLDVGCANGRVALGLSKKNYEVTAIDLSEDMVRVAQSISNDGALFKAQSMNLLELTDHYSQRFSGIYCLGNTLVHLDSEETIHRALKQFYDVLQTKGKLVIQILNYDHVYKVNLKELPLIENNKLTFKRTYELNDHQVKFKIDLTLDDTHEKYHSETLLFPIRKNQLQALLKSVGFHNIQYFGDYKGKNFSENDLTLIVTAEK